MSGIVVITAWRTFICRACGLIYDEAQGDADSGLAPGTRFDDIPDDWACPLCGVTKADFEPYDSAVVARTAAAPRRGGGTAPRNDPGVVIVGAGRAGWQMAQALRERDADVPITLVAACDAAVYDKPLLSVALAKGLTLPALVKESAEHAAQRLNVRLLPRTHAVSVTARAHTLRTTRGSLRYRHLVLAHGAAPREVATLPAALCWRINHRDAYVRFRTLLGEPVPHEARLGESVLHEARLREPVPREARLREPVPHEARLREPVPHEARLREPGVAAPQRVLIAGAGLVGCELANDLALAGHPVTLLDVNPLPLAALLSEAQSHELLAAWGGLPLRFVGGVQIAGVTRDGATCSVRCEGGQVFDAEHIVAATGLQTPPRLAHSAGLAWDNGIAVDPQTLRTNVADIHALGDCISIGGQAHRFIEPIARQARVIAANVLGGPALQYACTRPPVRVKTGSRAFTV